MAPSDSRQVTNCHRQQSKLVVHVTNRFGVSTSPALKLSRASRLVVEQFQALVPGRLKIRHERMIVSATLTLHHLLVLVDPRRIVSAVDDPTMAASHPNPPNPRASHSLESLSVCAPSPIVSGLLATGRQKIQVVAIASLMSMWAQKFGRDALWSP